MTWLVDPQTPFLCDSCDHFHPIGEHQACRDAAAGPEFEASGTGTAKARTSDPGAFRYFWANVVRKPCPECKHSTAVGFDRNNPETREPTKCVLCVKAEVDNAIQFARGEIGYPLTEQGPCANAECRAPHHLYGPNGHPLCRNAQKPHPTINGIRKRTSGIPQITSGRHSRATETGPGKRAQPFLTTSRLAAVNVRPNPDDMRERKRRGYEQGNKRSDHKRRGYLCSGRNGPGKLRSLFPPSNRTAFEPARVGISPAIHSQR